MTYRPCTNRLLSFFGAMTCTALTLASVTPAMAQDRDANSIRISTTDLDLRNPASVRTLDARIRHAVRAVCGVKREMGSVTATRCAREALQRAASQRDALVARSREAFAGEVRGRMPYQP